MTAGKPVWTSASFLLYAGGLLILFAATYELSYMSDRYDDLAFVGWSALLWVAFALIAAGFRRAGNWMAAGLFAVVSVVLWGVFVGAVEAWWGWLSGSTDDPFSGFDLGRLLLYSLVLLAALVSIARFRFPLLVLVACAAAWLFVTDLISGGGNWSAFVTLFAGVAFFLIALVHDGGPRRVYAFWLHVAAGLTIGGALVFFWHSGDVKWALVALGSLAYVALARTTGRSSWAVLGAFGLFLAAGHYALAWGNVNVFFFGDESDEEMRSWAAALVYLGLGFVYVLLGLLLERRRRDEPV